MARTRKVYKEMKRILLYNLPGNVQRCMMGGLGFTGGGDKLPCTELLVLASTIHNYGIEVKVIDGRFDPNYPVNDNYNYTIVSVSLPTFKSDVECIKGLIERGHKIVVKTNIRKDFVQLLKEELDNQVLVLSNECDLNIVQQLLDNKYDFCETVIENINILPIASRNLLDHTKYSFPFLGYNTATFQTSRGCPFLCSFYCSYPLVEGSKWRAMDADRIYLELDDIVNKNKINNILFRDATFTFDQNRVIQLCDLIIRNELKFNWWAETRIDRLDESLIETMHYSGCKGLNIGVESCSYLQSSLKQKNHLDNLIHISRVSKNLGFKLHWLLMVGFPGETKQTIYETWKFLKKYQPDSVGVTSVTPYPGTKLFNEAVKNKWIRDNITFNDLSGHSFIMKNDKMSFEDIKNGMIILQNYNSINEEDLKKWINH